MAATMATAVALVLLACIESGLALQTSGLSEDPCTYHVCPEGELCKAVYNHLLQVPVAACHEVATNHSNGPCTSRTVGANIMNCKTQSDWLRVCQTQCPLRGAPVLGNMAVNYACVSYSGNDVKFLQATCTCCTQVPTTSAPSTQVTQETPGNGNLLNSEKVNTDDPSNKDESNQPYPLLAIGLVAIAATVAVFTCAIVIMRRRRRYDRLPSKTVTVTSYENAGALVSPSPVVARRSYAKLEDHKHVQQETHPAPRWGYQKLIESYSSPDQ